MHVYMYTYVCGASATISMQSVHFTHVAAMHLYIEVLPKSTDYM